LYNVYLRLFTTCRCLTGVQSRSAVGELPSTVVTEPTSQHRPHRILAIEGIDGAGKETQAELLRDRLVGRGWSVRMLSFPVYSSFFGQSIRQLLDGQLGAGDVSADAVDPRSMALWYALDRWEAFRDPDLRRAGSAAREDCLLLNRSSAVPVGGGTSAQGRGRALPGRQRDPEVP
jgi:hypothetical protein